MARKRSKDKTEYYRLDSILATNSRYHVIFGERSNGKTYAVLERGIQQYFEGNGKMAIIRRWRDDFIGKRGAQMFDGLVKNGLVDKYSMGLWTSIYYYSGRWYFCKYEGTERIVDSEPFAYAFAINTMEHDKSTSYPDVRTILFDEFLTRGSYIPNEFVEFMNVLSTIIRERDDVKIFMCGNTVNQYSPYFAEMGLTNVKNMKQGTIDVYTYGESGLRVAVEYSDGFEKGKSSDVYFAFNNPKLNMIKTGAWEMDIYPHLPRKYVPKDVKFMYFIVFDNEILQCEVIQKDDLLFTFIHRKTTPLKDTINDLIYTTDWSPRPNYRRKINKPFSDLERKIWSFFPMDKVFYQSNEVGEIVRNYLEWCK